MADPYMLATAACTSTAEPWPLLAQMLNLTLPLPASAGGAGRHTIYMQPRYASQQGISSRQWPAASTPTAAAHTDNQMPTHNKQARNARMQTHRQRHIPAATLSF